MNNNNNNNKYHYTSLSGMREPKHVGEFSPEAHPGQLWHFFDDREVNPLNILRIPLFSIRF